MMIPRSDEKADPGAEPGIVPPWHYAETPHIRAFRESNRLATSHEINAAAGLAWSVYQAPLFMFVPGEMGISARNQLTQRLRINVRPSRIGRSTASTRSSMKTCSLKRAICRESSPSPSLPNSVLSAAITPSAASRGRIAS
jgi:hypothetical protein